MRRGTIWEPAPFTCTPIVVYPLATTLKMLCIDINRIQVGHCHAWMINNIKASTECKRLCKFIKQIMDE
jgi:hypothetical protein